MFTCRNLTVLHSVKDGSFDYDLFAYMIPVTDKNKAHAEFVNARMGGVDVSGIPRMLYFLPIRARSPPSLRKRRKKDSKPIF